MKDVADIIFLNGTFFTANEKMPQAEVVAIKGTKFLYVGSYSDADWKKYIGKATKQIDLGGKLILPGLIDAHVHPETIAKSLWHVQLPLTEDITELLSFVKDYCSKHPKEEVPYFFGESYSTAMFNEEGPKKELLDEYVSDRPVRLQDFTDHGCWMNSKALELMGITKDTCDPEGSAKFVRDECGKPTGWITEPGVEPFEFPIFEKIGWYPPQQVTEDMITPFLDFLTSKGVTAIFDGITEGESSMKLFYDMDRAGKLKMFYEGSVLLENINHLDECINTVKDWQKNYVSSHVNIRTVKFFLDGTNEMGTGAVLEPFNNDPTKTNFGRLNMTEDELTKTLICLNEVHINMHLHIVGDRAFRIACNAVERAQTQTGKKWMIHVTFAHCELIDPKDMPRIAKLNIIVNWSCHWAGGYFGEAAKEWLGEERWNRMYDFTKIIESGATVTYGSDVIVQSEAFRGNPFLGIECSHTRIDVISPLDEGVRKPASAKLSLKELVTGYTIRGSKQLLLDDQIGSIEVGKCANLVILKQDLFKVSANEIHTVEPDAVIFEGKTVYKK